MESIAQHSKIDHADTNSLKTVGDYLRRGGYNDYGSWTVIGITAGCIVLIPFRLRRIIKVDSVSHLIFYIGETNAKYFYCDDSVLSRDETITNAANKDDRRKVLKIQTSSYSDTCEDTRKLSFRSYLAGRHH